MKVRSYIKENGYKQSAVAQKAGISIVTFNAMMRGRRTMYADDLRAICVALNVSPELFIEVRESDDPPDTDPFRQETRKTRVAVRAK